MGEGLVGYPNKNLLWTKKYGAERLMIFCIVDQHGFCIWKKYSSNQIFFFLSANITYSFKAWQDVQNK